MINSHQFLLLLSKTRNRNSNPFTIDSSNDSAPRALYNVIRLWTPAGGFNKASLSFCRWLQLSAPTKNIKTFLATTKLSGINRGLKFDFYTLPFILLKMAKFSIVAPWPIAIGRAYASLDKPRGWQLRWLLTPKYSEWNSLFSTHSRLDALWNRIIFLFNGIYTIYASATLIRGMFW